MEKLSTFDFYHIFTLEPGARLAILEEQRPLVPWIASGKVILKPANPDETWPNAVELCIRGYGFTDEQSAKEAHDVALSTLKKELASLGIGADFTDRLQTGKCSKVFADQIFETTGSVVRPKFGLIIHPSSEKIFLFNASTEAVVTMVNSALVGTISSESFHEALTEVEEVAVDLLNDAAFLMQPEARFRQLMSALELFIEIDTNGDVVRLMPEVSMVSQTKVVKLEIPKTEAAKDSQKSKRRPISKRIRKFLQNFGKRRYGELSILSFYELCRTARDDLTHPSPSKIPPTSDYVAWLASNLKRLIGDLIAGEKMVVRVVEDSKEKSK